ncbi:MAG: ATP-dependent Clp protease adapter ClpS [Verrucomicrobiales bacterium]
MRGLQFFSTAAPEVEEEVVEKELTEDKYDGPWMVIVHNDPINLMSYVTRIFQKVFGYGKAKATKHMLEVHHMGQSVLWTGHREKAELYVQQLHGHLLHATLEKAEES